MGKGWTDAQRAIITQELEHGSHTFSDGTPNKARAFAAAAEKLEGERPGVTASKCRLQWESMLAKQDVARTIKEF